MNVLRPAAAKAAGVAAVLALLAGAAYFLLSKWESGMHPRIEIDKSSRELVFVDASGATQRYRAALGSSPTGAKQIEGDGATPEGAYFVCVKNPRSKYHLSLGLGYPGPRDAEPVIVQVDRDGAAPFSRAAIS